IGSGDAFAVLLDNDGDLIWSRTFGTPETVWQQNPDGPGANVHVPTGASDVAFDAAGNVILAGEFMLHVEFGDGTLDAANGADFVVALAAADGKTLWSNQIAQSWLPYVTADPSGDVIVGSTFQSASGGVLITKLDAGGALLWSKSFPGGGLAGASAVKA